MTHFFKKKILLSIACLSFKHMYMWFIKQKMGKFSSSSLKGTGKQHMFYRNWVLKNSNWVNNLRTCTIMILIVIIRKFVNNNFVEFARDKLGSPDDSKIYKRFTDLGVEWLGDCVMESGLFHEIQVNIKRRDQRSLGEVHVAFPQRSWELCICQLRKRFTEARLLLTMDRQFLLCVNSGFEYSLFRGTHILSHKY